MDAAQDFPNGWTSDIAREEITKTNTESDILDSHVAAVQIIITAPEVCKRLILYM